MAQLTKEEMARGIVLISGNKYMTTAGRIMALHEKFPGQVQILNEILKLYALQFVSFNTQKQGTKKPPLFGVVGVKQALAFLYHSSSRATSRWNASLRLLAPKIS